MRDLVLAYRYRLGIASTDPADIAGELAEPVA